MKIKIINISAILRKLYYYIVIVCLILGSKDTYFSHNNTLYMYLGMVTSLILLSPFIFIRGKVKYYPLKVCMLLLMFVFLSMIFNLDFSGYSLVITLAIALLVTELLDFEAFYLKFENVVFIICIFSLIVVAMKILGRPTILANVYRVLDNPAIPWNFRLCAIFREPAMLIIYVCLALARQLFVVEKASIFRVVVYLGAIVFTGSITGYITVSFALICYVLKTGISRNKMYLFIGVAVIGIMILGKLGIVEYFLERLSTKGASAASSKSRYYSIIGGMFVGMTHPLFGAGAIKSVDKFIEIVHFLGEDVTWANMITYLFGSFGFFYVYTFMKGLYRTMLGRKKIVTMGFLIMWCLLLCGETMTYSSIPYIFMLYGYVNCTKKNSKSYLLAETLLNS